MEIVNPFFTAKDDPRLSEISGAVPARGFMPRAGGRAKRGPLTAAVFCFILGLTSGTGASYAAYEKDPIKATQSKTVAVTEELLQREGDVGPATPTIKHKDTSEFLLKQPYEQAVNEVKEGLGEGKEPWWESWFFWLDDGSEKAEDGRDPSHS